MIFNCFNKLFKTAMSHMSQIYRLTIPYVDHSTKALIASNKFRITNAHLKFISNRNGLYLLKDIFLNRSLYKYSSNFKNQMFFDRTNAI